MIFSVPRSLVNRVNALRMYREMTVASVPAPTRSRAAVVENPHTRGKPALRARRPLRRVNLDVRVDAINI